MGADRSQSRRRSRFRRSSCSSCSSARLLLLLLLLLQCSGRVCRKVCYCAEDGFSMYARLDSQVLEVLVVQEGELAAVDGLAPEGPRVGLEGRTDSTQERNHIRTRP